MNVILYDRSSLATQLMSNFRKFYPNHMFWQVMCDSDLPSEDWIKNNNIALIVTTSLGPQLSLKFIKYARKLKNIGVQVFMPPENCVWLETSKVRTKKLLQSLNIPTAEGFLLKGRNINSLPRPFVVKYLDEFNLLGRQTQIVTDSFMLRTEHEEKDVLIENFLIGNEFSYQVLCNGYDFVFFGISRDFKKYQNYNTTGVAAISECSQKPIPEINTYIKKILLALRLLGTPYRGILYFNIMQVNNVYYILEINTRFGNPETQSLCSNIQSNLFAAFYLAASGHKLFPIVSNGQTGVTVQLFHRNYDEHHKLYPKFPNITQIPPNIVFGFQNQWSRNNIFGSLTNCDTTVKQSCTNIYSYLKNIDLGDYIYKDNLI